MHFHNSVPFPRGKTKKVSAAFSSLALSLSFRVGPHGAAEALLNVARLSEGLSGRALRKLPFQAHAFYVQVRDPLRSTVAFAFFQRNALMNCLCLVLLPAVTYPSNREAGASCRGFGFFIATPAFPNRCLPLDLP